MTNSNLPYAPEWEKISDKNSVSTCTIGRMRQNEGNVIL